MFRVLAASLAPAAAAALLAASSLAASDLAAPLAALAVAGAVLAVWNLGAPAPGGPGAVPHLPGPPAPDARRHRRRDRWTGAGLALALGAGTLLAAGFADGPGPFGLPRSLWGLLLGVWLLPLLITSVGAAAAFRPPDPAGLDRLRAAKRPAS